MCFFPGGCWEASVCMLPRHGEVAAASEEMVIVTSWCALHCLSSNKAGEQPSTVEASSFQDTISCFLLTQPLSFLFLLLWEGWQFSCVSGAPSFPSLLANALRHSLKSLISLGLFQPPFSFPLLLCRLSAYPWYSQLSSPVSCEKSANGHLQTFPLCTLCFVSILRISGWWCSFEITGVTLTCACWSTAGG